MAGDRRASQSEVIKQKIELNRRPKLEARYGVKPADIFGESNVAEILRRLFATARMMLEKDGYHVTIAFLLREGRPVGISGSFAQASTVTSTPFMMRSLAYEVAKRGADAVILFDWRGLVSPCRSFKADDACGQFS